MGISISLGDCIYEKAWLLAMYISYNRIHCGILAGKVAGHGQDVWEVVKGHRVLWRSEWMLTLSHVQGQEVHLWDFPSCYFLFPLFEWKPQSIALKGPKVLPWDAVGKFCPGHTGQIVLATISPSPLRKKPQTKTKEKYLILSQDESFMARCLVLVLALYLYSEVPVLNCGPQRLPCS